MISLRFLVSFANRVLKGVGCPPKMLFLCSPPKAASYEWMSDICAFLYLHPHRLNLTCFSILERKLRHMELLLVHGVQLHQYP